MQCSVCQSTNLVKVSLAYEQGLSDLQCRSRCAAFPWQQTGWAYGAARSRTNGTIQTRLSARLSPPTKMSYWKTSVWWFLGLLALWFVAHCTDAGQRSQGGRNSAGNCSGSLMPMSALWSFCGGLSGDTTTACSRFSTDAGTVPSCADAVETSNRISKEKKYDQSGDQRGAGQSPIRRYPA